MNFAQGPDGDKFKADHSMLPIEVDSYKRLAVVVAYECPHSGGKVSRAG